MKKSLSSVRIKDADQGLVEAVFSTFDELDRDGDITAKGAFTDGAPLVISAYGHRSWDGELPVGKGVIRVGSTEAIADMQFFLETTHGRDTFETVKQLSEAGLQEWSYSLQDVVSEWVKVDGRSARLLKKITVKEVSPVLVGAGMSTRTLTAKAARKQLASTVARMLGEAAVARWQTEGTYVYLDDFDIDASTAVFCVTDYSVDPRDRRRLQVTFERTDTGVTLGDEETEVEYTTLYLPKSSKFADHRDAALSAVKGVVEMAVERLAHRAAEGKSITEQTDAYDQLVAELAPLKSAIDATPTSQSKDDVEREYLRFVALSQGAMP